MKSKFFQKKFWWFILAGLIVILTAVIVWRLSLSKRVDLTPSPSSWLPSLNKIDRADISQFGLDIPQLNIWAPVIADVDGYNKDIYLKKIEKGVAQFAGSKNPDENGNLFIFGHSEYYKNKPGAYKEVFKELNKLKPGDKFNLYYKGIKYEYEVSDSKRVSKADWSIMDPTPDIKNDRTITLMTCYPPGTLDARWVVFAKQI